MWIKEQKPTMDVEFLMTQALDFLMTEDDDYLVTQSSHSWVNELKPTN